MTHAKQGNAIGYDVNYDVLDDFKRQALQAARETAEGLKKAGFKEIPESRGESVYLIEGHGMILAFVVEGLGTLNKIAEDMLVLTGESYMAQIMRANHATILNDLAVCGAYPLVANNLISVGDERWFANEQARADLVQGWKDACIEVGCSWGGGETQKLRDIVVPSSAVLGGAAMGIIKPKNRRIRGNVQDDDALVVVHSSGIHANGVTMARDVAKMLPDGFLTRLPNLQTFGDALLKAPHVLYGPLIQAALDAKIPLHYASNITGHGWRKGMRLNADFTYCFDVLPKPQPVFEFIQEHSGASNRKMYETFNMGGGCLFALPNKHSGHFMDVIKKLGYEATYAGYVEKGKRAVVMPQGSDIGVFESEEYQVR